MSELETFAQIIKNILSNDNEVRKQSEELLNVTKDRNPDEYFLGLLELLKGSTDEAVRNFACVMLRKQLSLFSEANFKSSWGKINGQTAAKLKEELFVALSKEPTSTIRHGICSLIGELAGSISHLPPELMTNAGNENKEWAVLVPTIMKLWVSGIPTMMESTLRIMSRLFNYNAKQFLEHKKDLYTVFQKGLEHEDANINAAAIDTFTSWISHTPSREAKMYQDLIPAITTAVIKILAVDEYQGTDTLGNLIDLVEQEPRFFKKYFSHLFQAMQKICGVKNIEDEGLKQMAIQVICCFAEREPKVFEDDTKLLRDYLEMILAYMIEICETPDEDWEVPEEGYLEVFIEETDYSGVKYGCSVIDRLAGCIGQQVVLKSLAGIVQQMLANEDWRFRYIGLMSLSQLGEHVELNDMTPVIEIASKYFKDPHSKIRWAAFHIIGMVAGDCQPEFQTRFHQSIIPALLQSTEELVPRVLSHVLSCLQNFVEGMPEECTPPYIEPILNTVFPIVQNGKFKIVRESGLTVISSLAEASKTNFRPYYEKCIPYIYEMMKTYNKKEQKQIRGQSIECITLIGNAVGKEYFAKFVPEVVQTLLDITKNDISADGTDPQRSYVLSGWQRICVTLGEDFIPYLDLILPSLLKLVEDVIGNAPQEDNDYSEYTMPEEKKTKKERMDDIHRVNYNTFDHEEAETAINMILVFINELKKGFIPYVEKTTEIILKAVTYTINNNIRERAANCLPLLLEAVKESNYEFKDQVLVKMAHMFIGSLWQEVQKEFDPDTIMAQVVALRNCIDVCGRFMTQQELDDLSSKILKLLAESDKRKTEMKDMRQLDEDEEDNHTKTLEQEEEELHIGIADLIGVLFKTHKEMTIPLVNILYTQVLTKVLQPNMSDKLYKFGLYLIDDMIEFLGIELIPELWKELSQVIINFANHKTSELRQAALYGIGLLAQKSPAAFGDIADVCIQKVVDSFKIPKGNEAEKLYQYSLDNSIATLGKIMDSHSNKVNVPVLAKLWFTHLPLKKDKPEAHQQHEMLMDILLKGNASMLLGENGEGIGHLIKIIAQITDTKLSNDKIQAKMSQVLKSLAQGPTQALVEKAVVGLSELQKTRIASLLKM